MTPERKADTHRANAVVKAIRRMRVFRETSMGTESEAGVIISSNSCTARTQVASSSGLVLKGGNTGSGAMTRAEVVSTLKRVLWTLQHG